MDTGQRLLRRRDEVFIPHDQEPLEVPTVPSKPSMANEPVRQQAVQRRLTPFLRGVRNRERVPHHHNEACFREKRLQKSSADKIRWGLLNQYPAL